MAIKIAVMSVADMRNYGDMLFPFVARHELAKRLGAAEFRFFTPTAQIIEGEEFFAYSYENLLAFKPDVVMVAGGEVIHNFDVIWERAYQNVHGKRDSEKVSDIFFQWLSYPDSIKVWFAVGAIGLPVGIASECLSNLDYIGVRGILSKKILEDVVLLRNDSRIKIVPDIGWLFTRYLHYGSGNILSTLSPDEYIVCNVNSTSIDPNMKSFIRNAILDCARKNGLKVVEMLQMAGRHVSLFNDEDDVLRCLDLNLKSSIKLLEGGRLYFGSSLHCAITALGNGKPAGLIHKKPLTKFQDLFGNLMLIDKMFSDNWNDTPEILNNLINFKDNSILRHYVSFARESVDDRFDELCKMIQSKL